MLKKKLEVAFSEPRTQKYFKDTSKEQGFINYTNSQHLSSLFYIPFSVFEIVLRNRVIPRLGENWREKLDSIGKWENTLGRSGVHKDNFKYTTKKKKQVEKTLTILADSISNCKKNDFPMLGFYTRLFDTKNSKLFHKIYIKPILEDIGITTPGKQTVILSKIHSEFNNIRDMRNRTYHYESLKNKYSRQLLFNCLDSVYFFIKIFNTDAYTWIQNENPLEELKTKVSDLYNSNLEKVENRSLKTIELMSME